MAGSILCYIWFKLTPDQELTIIAIGQENIFALLILGFLVFGAFWVVFDITYYTYIRPLKRMSAEAGVIYSSNPSHRIKQITGSKDITNMARVINDFADMFENLNKTITEQILAARKETEKERNLLAAIMAELPQGVVICNKSGRILLYNSLAKNIFTQKTEHFIGLGRSIFHLIDKGLIAHAIDEIRVQLNNNHKNVGSYFISPVSTGSLISVEAIPILDQDGIMTGFTLAIQDISSDIRKYEAIDSQLSRFQTTLKNEILIPIQELTAVINPLLMDSLESDSIQLSEINLEKIDINFQKISSIIRDISFSRLPLTTLDLKNFLAAIQKKSGNKHDIRVNVFKHSLNTRFLADSYSLTQAFVFLIKNLSTLSSLKEFDLIVSNTKNILCFEISWESSPLEISDLESIMHKKINGLPKFGYVFKFNNARIKFLSMETKDKTTCSCIRVFARAAKESISPVKQRAAVMAGSRPEFYDFDLFNVADQSKNFLDTSLKEITYTVFDTETTGLNPDGGDEIISIGAVRIVNNRITYQDIFEELIDPKRDIPIESYKIHGINYEMVMEKEPIEKVLPIFKKFTADTVLLGHNLAFDMKMLKVKEKTTEIAFRNLTLDTLLLSAILHPVHVQHDIENIARRLGVNIIGRHTALGDAITTAEIFLKLIPILNSNGIFTLKDALKASKKSYYARLKY